MAKGKIEQEIALKVTGIKDVKDAEKIVAELDGETAVVKIDVDANQGIQAARAFERLIDDLSDEDKTIVLKARADQAEREIKKLTGQLGRAKDVNTIEVKVTAIGNARAELADIKGQLEKLDGETVDINVKATGLDKVGDTLGDLPGSLGAISGAMRGLGTAGGLGALAAGGVALANSLAEASLSAEVLARLTGDTIENASRLQAVWKNTGADANDLADVLLQMNGVFTDTPEMAAQIGVNLEDGATIGERFVQIVDLVQKGLIDSATQSKIFGEEGVRQVARLTSTYDDLNKALGEVAEQQVFTAAERDDLERFSRSMTELKVAAADVGAEIGDRIVPVLTALFGAIDKAKEAIEWLDEKAPDDAERAGLSASDIFSSWPDIFNDLKYNFNVLIGRGQEFKNTFDDFAGGEFGAEVDVSTEAVKRNAKVIQDWVLDANKYDDTVRRNIKTLQEWAQAQQDAANEAAISLDQAQHSVEEMASSFNDMARREGAIDAAFAISNAPIKALEAVVDVNEAIRDLGEFVRDEGVPDIFDPNDVDVQPFLAKIASLRQPIQARIAEAFAAGGPEAARQMAAGYLTQLVESLKGHLSREQVEGLFPFLTGIEVDAIINVAVDQESFKESELLLQTLTGLTGQTPWTAEIALAIASGALSPQAAQLLIAEQLEGLGVDVDTKLLPPDDASRNAAIAEANLWATTHPVDMQSNVNDPKVRSLIEARNAGELWTEDHPIRWPSIVLPPRQSAFDLLRGGLFNDAGNPSVPYPGGIAGERGPELLDGRYLTTGPTYVPPGTRVTSRRQTRVMLRQGLRGLRRYDRGGVVPIGPVTVNVNTAVIGNQFETARAIRRGVQTGFRLFGHRA